MPSSRKEQLRNEANTRMSIRKVTSTAQQIEKVLGRLPFVGGSAAKELTRLGHISQ